MATKKKTTAKSTKTAAKKKTVSKKTVKKKTAAKKTATRKTPAKKTTARKAPAKKATAKKAPAKKAKKTVTAKKTAKKKAPAKKAPAKKTAAKKAPAKKTAAKKAPAKKAPAKKAPAKKVAAKAAAPKPAKKVKLRVGQAPRKTSLAASIPVPSQSPVREAPQADAKASIDKEASGAAKLDFKVNDQIVYPAHGVGKIVALEKQEVAGITIELFVINFDQEKMRLRVPTGKAKAAGMRALSDDKSIKNAVELLKGRARIKRTMWSRRAQEYDAKINSGDIKLVAEVVRDLYRSEEQPEQSYSERQLFEAALDRMAREVAAVRKFGLEKAIEELEASLRQKKAV